MEGGGGVGHSAMFNEGGKGRMRAAYNRSRQEAFIRQDAVSYHLWIWYMLLRYYGVDGSARARYVTAFSVAYTAAAAVSTPRHLPLSRVIRSIARRCRRHYRRRCHVIRMPSPSSRRHVTVACINVTRPFELMKIASQARQRASLPASQRHQQEAISAPL